MSVERQLTIRCNGTGCQEVKGDNNHWFVARFDDGNEQVVIEKLHEEDAKDTDFHFCGEACLIKGLPSLFRRLLGIQ